jgi:hypothetical protein
MFSGTLENSCELLAAPFITIKDNKIVAMAKAQEMIIHLFSKAWVLSGLTGILAVLD